MKNYCHCIDPLRRSPTQEIKLSEVEEIMSMGDESLWLIPIMAPILQEQGTNLRAMCHHILKCRESVALKPKLDGVTVQKTVTTVINEHLLHLLPEADLDQVWNGSQKLKTVLATKSKAERGFLLMELCWCPCSKRKLEELPLI